MKVLLDHSFVHRIGEITNESHSNTGTTYTKALILLHAVEHILFAEEAVVDFSPCYPEYLSERTHSIIHQIKSLGISGNNNDQKIIIPEQFETNEVYESCSESSGYILDDLTDMTAKELGSLGDRFNQCAIPIGVDCKAIDFVTGLYQKFDKDDVIEIANEKYRERFIIRAILQNDTLFTKLSNLRKQVGGKFTELHCAALHTLIRIRINERLAISHSFLYSPNPARSVLSLHTEDLYRHRIEKEIIKLAKRDNIRFKLNIFNKLAEYETVPMPLFALYFLKGIKADNSKDLLLSAFRLRSRKDVADFRKWLMKREISFISGDIDKIRKTSIEIEYYINELSGYFKNDFKKSLIRFVNVGATINSTTGATDFSLNFDHTGIFQKLFTKWIKRPPVAIPIMINNMIDKEQYSDLITVLTKVCE